MHRLTTIVVAALLAAPTLAQRPAERPAEPGRAPRSERAQPERAGEKSPRPTDDLEELRREVQRLRLRLERLQNVRAAGRRGPDADGPERQRSERGGALRDRMQRLRERADRNHDGQLDQAERDAAREVIQRRVRAWRELRGEGRGLDAPRGRSEARPRAWPQGPAPQQQRPPQRSGRSQEPKGH
jgi:hypothetical protein